MSIKNVFKNILVFSAWAIVISSLVGCGKQAKTHQVVIVTGKSHVPAQMVLDSIERAKGFLSKNDQNTVIGVVINDYPTSALRLSEENTGLIKMHDSYSSKEQAEKRRLTLSRNRALKALLNENPFTASVVSLYFDDNFDKTEYDKNKAKHSNIYDMKINKESNELGTGQHWFFLSKDSICVDSEVGGVQSHTATSATVRLVSTGECYTPSEFLVADFKNVDYRKILHMANKAMSSKN
jgi:hypothetical protein